MLQIPFEKFVLDNGLRVILHRDQTSPLVAVDLWYHVGSKDEQPGRTGFAHLFEHLMFMGSAHAPYPAFDATMEKWGGHNNGTTSNDRTNYYEIGPANLLETFLWLEADRLATLPDVITEEELQRQLKVVQNERRQSYENRPYGRAELIVPETMYEPSHPYHWPVIGSHADLEAATVADVRAFFDRFYRPSNASLVVAGDFEPAEARRLVNQYFGWLPARPAPPAVTATVRPLAATERREVADRVQLPRLRMEWHSPALFAPGDADLDLAAQILGGGKSSRLYKALVFEQRIAQDAWAYQSSLMLGSLFGVGVTAKPGQGLDDIEKATMAVIDRFAAEGPTDSELERARNSHSADFYKSLDNLQTRADLLNHYERLLGDPGGMAEDMARFTRATTTSVREAFASMIAAHHLVLTIVPDGTTGEGDGDSDGDGADLEDDITEVDVGPVTGGVR
ncbi:MAG: insulinase family protein [Deltaproteobacteria bacterium]|nr:insulinase family protein [Deltaproteobacteria bacterium]